MAASLIILRGHKNGSNLTKGRRVTTRLAHRFPLSLTCAVARYFQIGKRTTIVNVLRNTHIILFLFKGRNKNWQAGSSDNMVAAVFKSFLLLPCFLNQHNS